MELGFIKADSDNLPRVDVEMINDDVVFVDNWPLKHLLYFEHDGGAGVLEIEQFYCRLVIKNIISQSTHQKSTENQQVISEENCLWGRFDKKVNEIVPSGTSQSRAFI
ncbi:hypothetical protein NQ315_015347 [Exocentrus adspersus]|uniref:Uncharacterized protein n=1 Tax=Exocentrus adspersus TaxID=1586481 RepID=A0AAV8V5H2_9CUCU|nr:hypothetical protein NQ315_015347 [Exocentrus adspersus]